MPFDCNCHGINFQKEFADAAQTKLRVEDALDKTFTDIGLSVPDDKTALREASLVCEYPTKEKEIKSSQIIL